MGVRIPLGAPHLARNRKSSVPPAWHSAGISSLPGHLPAAGRPVVLDVVGRRLAAGAQRPGRAAPGEGGTRREGAPGGRCLARRAVPGRRSPTARLAQVPRGGTGRAAFVSNDMPKRGTPVDEPPWYELPLPGSRPEVVAWLRERTRLREAISSRLRSTDSSTQGETNTRPSRSHPSSRSQRGRRPRPRGWPRPAPEERCRLERRLVSPKRPPAAGRTPRATAGRRTAAGGAPRGLGARPGAPRVPSVTRRPVLMPRHRFTAQERILLASRAGPLWGVRARAGNETAWPVRRVPLGGRGGG